MKSVIQTYKDKKIVENFDEEREEFDYQREKDWIEKEFVEEAKNTFNTTGPYWGLKILDVGCGTGRMLGAGLTTVRGGSKYYGIDTSKEMLKKLKEKEKFIECTKKEVNTKIGDAQNIPYKDNYFDVVFSYHLLWHLPKKEQEKIIKEMFRVSQKIVIFDIVNKNFIWNKIKWIFGIKDTKGIYKLSIKEVEEIIGNREYKIEKLNDIIMSDEIYKYFRIINWWWVRKVLPSCFYHMVYFRVKK